MPQIDRAEVAGAEGSRGSVHAVPLVCRGGSVPANAQHFGKDSQAFETMPAGLQFLPSATPPHIQEGADSGGKKCTRKLTHRDTWQARTEKLPTWQNLSPRPSPPSIGER